MPPTPVLSLRSNQSPSLSSQPRPPRRVSRQASLALVSAARRGSSVRESLRFALRTPVAALSSMAPKLPPSATRSFYPRRGFLVRGNLSSFTAPSHWCRSRPYSFVSVISFFFCPTQGRGEFLAFLEVGRFLPAFSGCSVGAVPLVDVFLLYLWEER